MKYADEASRTIEDLQVRIEKALKCLRNAPSLPPELEDLRHLAPKGLEPQVSFIRSDKDRKIRKIRRNAAVDYWQPGNCQALIAYERREEDSPGSDRPAHQSDQPSERQNDTHVADKENSSGERIKNLIEALDQAESSPERRFVALKWFRDTFLPGQGFSWTFDDAERNRILRLTTERGLVLTARIPNPKSPAFPTTTVRLNRGHPDFPEFASQRPEVKRFRPIRIKGRPLSQTVLEGRR